MLRCWGAADEVCLDCYDEHTPYSRWSDADSPLSPMFCEKPEALTVHLPWEKGVLRYACTAKSIHTIIVDLDCYNWATHKMPKNGQRLLDSIQTNTQLKKIILKSRLSKKNILRDEVHYAAAAFASVCASRLGTCPIDFEVDLAWPAASVAAFLSLPQVRTSVTAVSLTTEVRPSVTDVSVTTAPCTNVDARIIAPTLLALQKLATLQLNNVTQHNLQSMLQHLSSEGGRGLFQLKTLKITGMPCWYEGSRPVSCNGLANFMRTTVAANINNLELHDFVWDLETSADLSEALCQHHALRSLALGGSHQDQFLPSIFSACVAHKKNATPPSQKATTPPSQWALFIKHFSSPTGAELSQNFSIDQVRELRLLAHWDQDTMQAVCRVLQNSTNLERLILDMAWRIKNAVIQTLANGLRDNRSLRSLTLGDTDTDTDPDTLNDFRPILQTIQSIQNEVRHEYETTNRHVHSNRLVDLDWRGTIFDEESICFLTRLIEDDFCQIRSLKMHLEGDELANDIALIRAIQAKPTIEELALECGNFYGGAPHLVDSLVVLIPGMRYLKHLSVREFNMHFEEKKEEYTQLFARHMRHNTSLHRLSLPALGKSVPRIEIYCKRNKTMDACLDGTLTAADLPDEMAWMQLEIDALASKGRVEESEELALTKLTMLFHRLSHIEPDLILMPAVKPQIHVPAVNPQILLAAVDPMRDVVRGRLRRRKRKRKRRQST